MVGCIVCVENPQFSLFWATTFWLAVAKQMQYSVFHSCQYGGVRKKKTMLAFNSEVFHAVSAKCTSRDLFRDGYIYIYMTFLEG